MDFELRPFFENEVYYEVLNGILYAYHRTNDELLGSAKFPVDINSDGKTTEDIEKIAKKFEFSIEDAVVKMIERNIYTEGKYNIIIADDTLTFYDYEQEDWVNHKREGIYEWIGTQIEKQIAKEDEENKEIEKNIQEEEPLYKDNEEHIVQEDKESLTDKKEPEEESIEPPKEIGLKEADKVLDNIGTPNEIVIEDDVTNEANRKKEETIDRDILEVWLRYYETYNKQKNTIKHGKTVEQLVVEAKKIIKDDFGDPKTIETTELLEHMMDQIQGLHNTVLVMYAALYEVYMEE